MIKLQKKETNTGRQREIDLVKGFEIIMIIVIHAFQTIAIMNPEARGSYVYKYIFMFFMPTAACLYLFVMGFGSVYSRKNSPGQLAIGGVKLLFYQGLSNVCYTFVLMVSYKLRILLGGEVPGTERVYKILIENNLTFVNIFFIAGMGYLVLAILKKIKLPTWGYIVGALTVALITPSAAGLKSDNKALGWILDMTFGGMEKTSFPFFPFLSFVFLGYVFARLMRRIREEDKGEFYKLAGLGGSIVILIWLAIIIPKHYGVNEFFAYFNKEYRTPGIAKVVGSTCAIVVSFAIAYGLQPVLKKWNYLYDKLIWYSNQISKLYAIHIGIYMAISGATAFYGFSTAQCLLISVAVIVATDIIVQLYEGIEVRKAIKKD